MVSRAALLALALAWLRGFQLRSSRIGATNVRSERDGVSTELEAAVLDQPGVGFSFCTFLVGATPLPFYSHRPPPRQA